jgi:proteasome lid subunit RPN8/RPN11
MRSHVEAQAPLEACGLLAGKEDVVERVFLIENALQSAVRFQMDPAEQLSAFDWMESNGQDLLGIFHSHPAGPEMISETDIAESMYLVVQVVWSRPGGTWQARGFWIEQGEAREVELQIAGAE